MSGCKAMAVLPTPKPTSANRLSPALTPESGAGRLESAGAFALDSVNPALPALQALHGLVLPVGVAYSGGADSTALLLAALQCWPGQVQAIHVHHGLQAAANDFVRVCESVCAERQVPLHVVLVDAGHASGESPEDAARRARYAALAGVAAKSGLAAVLLGQHADDQVETLLLALSRGAGLPGLAGMAPQFERAGAMFYRPLLQISAGSLRAWLVQQPVSFVEDPTNRDERYTRNRIRARLLPALAEAFPQFRTTFARSARHASQAQAVLREVAQQDLLLVGSPPAIQALQSLSPPRQANLLRHWLAQQHATPSAAQLDQLMAQITACRTRGQQIHLKVATGHVRRDGPVLHYSASPGKRINPSVASV
jgi:tRNA(Ile)-lysidine synthase